MTTSMSGLACSKRAMRSAITSPSLPSEYQSMRTWVGLCAAAGRPARPSIPSAAVARRISSHRHRLGSLLICPGQPSGPSGSSRTSPPMRPCLGIENPSFRLDRAGGVADHRAIVRIGHGERAVAVPRARDRPCGRRRRAASPRGRGRRGGRSSAPGGPASRCSSPAVGPRATASSGPFACSRASPSPERTSTRRSSAIDLVEDGERQVGVGEVRRLRIGVEGDDRQRPVVMQARQRPAAAPEGRPREAADQPLARVVDPDLRVRVVADAGVQHRLLIAPQAGAVGGERADREMAALVVVERGEAALALDIGPFEVGRPIPERQLGKAVRRHQAMVADVERQERQGLDLAAVPAAAPEHPGDAGELQGARRAQRVLVAAPLRGREQALMAGMGDDLQQPLDRGLGAVCDLGLAGERVQRAQALEVDREVGCRVPLGHLAGLEMIEPADQALAPGGALLAAGSPGAGEDGVGEQAAGEIAGGMEQQGVVLAVEPHHVVARLVEPVAEARASRGRSRPAPRGRSHRRGGCAPTAAAPG